MLNNIQSKQIFKKLVELNLYSIERIVITFDCFILSFDITFLNSNDYLNFRDIIFNLIYVDISENLNNHLNLIINFEDSSNYNDFIKKLDFPESIEEIQILSKTNIIDENIKLNFPSNLKKLSIISSQPIDITNLPNKLIVLDLSLCEEKKKFNLNFLPESLKILKLGDKLIYKRKDLENLPIGLNEIYIGNLFFNSIQKIYIK